MDEDSGYRFYEPDQLGQARLIATLRQLQVPLAEIKVIVALEPGDPRSWIRRPRTSASDRPGVPARPSELASRRQIETELELALGPERFGQPRTLLIALNETSLIYDHGQ